MEMAKGPSLALMTPEHHLDLLLSDKPEQVLGLAPKQENYCTSQTSASLCKVRIRVAPVK